MTGRQQYVKCLYGRNLIPIEESIKVGSFCGGPYSFFMHKSRVEEHKESRKLFDQNDRNCNTCIHLQRVKHKKEPTGFLTGICKSTPINHPYKLRSDGTMIFHPEDPMHMACYEPRNP